jgi:hypothetical protein
VAQADVEWTLGKKQGRPLLNGFSGEYEGDDEFWAHCRKDGSIDIGVGAHSRVGRGRGDAVRLTIASAGERTMLSGASRWSMNSEMTGGTELRARVRPDDALFAVLRTGKPIAVTGSIEQPARWGVAGLKQKVAAFLQACK